MGWAEELLPADLTYDDNGTAKPIRESDWVKNAPDLKTFVTTAHDAHREVGARVPVRLERERAEDGTFRPKVESIERWRRDHLPKLYENGILERPPADPKDYNIQKPEKLTEGVNWSADRAANFAALGVKHGVSKAAMAEFLAMHQEAVSGVAAVLKTDYDTAMVELKREFKDQTEPLMEDAKRLMKYIIKNEQEMSILEESGLANHPRLLS